MVGNKIGNLTPNPSFGHNLCFKCPNGSCEPILDIYIRRAFNDIRKFSTQWALTPIIAFWKFRTPSRLHRDSNSQNGSSLRSVGVHSLTLSYVPGSMTCDSRASFLAHTFANPCLSRKPKFRVTTRRMYKCIMGICIIGVLKYYVAYI